MPLPGDLCGAEVSAGHTLGLLSRRMHTVQLLASFLWSVTFPPPPPFLIFRSQSISGLKKHTDILVPPLIFQPKKGRSHE